MTCSVSWGAEVCSGRDGGPQDNGLFGVLPSTFHIFLGFTACRALVQQPTPAGKLRRLFGWGVLFAACGLVLDLSTLIPIS